MKGMEIIPGITGININNIKAIYSRELRIKLYNQKLFYVEKIFWLNSSRACVGVSCPSYDNGKNLWAIIIPDEAEIVIGKVNEEKP